MTRTKQTKRKKTHQNGDAPQNKKVKEWITSDLISIGLQGFSISYDRSHLKASYYEVVSQVTQLLDVYADRIYRTDEKTCTIKHRQTDPESSLIFVETDMEDPAVLVDAIYTDLLAPRHKQCDDVKNARHWSRVFPVQMVCTNEYEDLMTNAKALLKPILEEDGESKIKILHYGFKGGFNLFEELMEYLGSKGSIGESDPDIGVVFRACGTLCLISVIRNYAKYRKYCIRSINNKKSVDESSKPHLLTSDGATVDKSSKTHLLTSDGATEEDRLPKVQEDEQQTIPEDQTTVSDQIVKNDQAATNGELAVYGQVGADDLTTATDQTTIGNQTSTNDQTTKADQTVIDDPTMKTDQIATSDLTCINNQTTTSNQTVMDDQTTKTDQMTTINQTFTENQATTAEQTVVNNQTDTADVTDTNGETKTAAIPNEDSSLQCQDTIVTSEVIKSGDGTTNEG